MMIDFSLSTKLWLTKVIGLVYFDKIGWYRYNKITYIYHNSTNMSRNAQSLQNATDLWTGQIDWVSSWFQNMINSDYFRYIGKVWIAIVVFMILFFLTRYLASLASKKFYESSNIKDLNKTESLGQLIYDIVFYVLLIIDVFIAFQIVWFDLGILLGGISFGVWFAFREVLGNMIAGVMLLSVKEIKLWDIIEVWKYFGKIEEITIRYTTIRTLDLRQVILPNMELITNPIKTYSSEELVRLDTTVPIAYNGDVDKAIEVIKQALHSMDIIQDKKKIKVFVSAWWDHAIVIKCLFYVDPNCGIPKYYIIWDVNKTIAIYFRDHGIKFPYKHIAATMDENDQNTLRNIKFIKDYDWVNQSDSAKNIKSKNNSK